MGTRTRNKHAVKLAKHKPLKHCLHRRYPHTNFIFMVAQSPKECSYCSYTIKKNTVAFTADRNSFFHHACVGKACETILRFYKSKKSSIMKLEKELKVIEVL